MVQNDTLVRRLVYVKLLHYSAKEQFSKNIEIEISRSIVTLDNCLESYFWTILESKMPEKINQLHGKSFRELVKQVSDFISDFDVHSINELHDVRNDIQHKGIQISNSQASKYFPMIERMFVNSCKEIFQLDWNFVSLSLLINNEEIATHYRNFEQYFYKKDFRNSAKSLIKAFEIAKSYRQLSQAGSQILFYGVNASGVISQYPKIKPLLDYVEKIEQELEILKMNIEYNQWKTYREVLEDLNPHHSLYYSGSNDNLDSLLLIKAPEEEIEKWIKENVSFVFETILKWQNSIESANRMTKDIIEGLESITKLLDSKINK